MRLVLTSKRPCRLERGEARRVPQDRAGRLVGYHVACPKCRFVWIALDGHRGLAVTEGEEIGDVSFSKPVECAFCRTPIGAEHGEFRFGDRTDV